MIAVYLLLTVPLLGMMVFRHKSAKPSFQLKFGLALPVWLALVAGALRVAGRI